MFLDRFSDVLQATDILLGVLISKCMLVDRGVAFFLIGRVDQFIVFGANRDHTAWRYVLYALLRRNSGPELGLELKELLDLVETRMLTYLGLVTDEKLAKI